MIRNLLASSALALIAACATTPADLEPLDPEAFQAASPVEEVTDHPVRIVETAVPLPLPGQMKAVASATAEPDVSPEKTIKEGREHALIEPSVDGYVNAIQVYPYTEGAPLPALCEPRLG